MNWGMKNRLSRIFDPETGKTLMFAVDHGYFMGPTTGLENITETVDPLLPYADTLMLTRGALRNYIAPEKDTSIILRVSSGTSILNKKLLHEGLSVSMEEALRMNASAVAFSIMVGAEFERDTLLAFSQLVDEAERYGMPTLAVTAVGKGLDRDARYLSLATRIAGELGARVVKTYYCDNFERVTSTSPVPVVIAGGKKVPEKDALTTAYNAIQAGAAGVDMGRNIFQSENPVAMVQAVRAIVHDGATPEQAFEMFNELK
ncbi:MAG TPA: 3-hydroxy-5-phosphonooxypentane-2,4-dione thiolase [Anaerolineae bacterium]|nr:3-hydroxy-5-phosphonooxypentane-2,4-dione thiolase [Anaerolineae bacterium]